MRRKSSNNILGNIDWITVSLYLTLVIMGWFNIYAAVYNENHQSILDVSQKYGKQMIWIISALIIALIILIIDVNFYTTFSYPIYIFSCLMLILVLFIGKEVSGSKSWFRVGELGIQPAEFAKFAVNLALAKYLSNMDIKLSKLTTKIYSASIVIIPFLLILAEHETGVALVFLSFIFVLYREGLSGNILLLGILLIFLFILALLVDKLMLTGILTGIAFLVIMIGRKNKQLVGVSFLALLISCAAIFGTDYAFQKLEPHQKKRINVFLGKEMDKTKAGYNVNQAKIAIGSGGFWGKGFLEGTQTKFDFVPEQDTDFIFCTVGEEWGFVGTTIVVALFVILITRIVFMAERQRSAFGRIYGYGVASILFFHLTINVGMTIGLMPVIGIPLPFFSYGGSSLWAFTILLFIFIKFDSERLEILR